LAIFVNSLSTPFTALNLLGASFSPRKSIREWARRALGAS
jgi:hypothetical protein